ncbi:MAG: TetR/AcrR family transcriptional regulator [Syntrophomonadaceae bacterium]
MEPRRSRSDDRRVRKTKKVLKESLATLLLEKNINSITVQELVKHAGINRGTFYLHYRDIYDMLSQIEMEMIEEMEEISKRYPPSLGKNSHNPYIAALLQYIWDNRTFCKMLLGPFGDMAFVEELKKLVAQKRFSYLMDSYPYKKLQDYQYCVAFTVGGCIGLIQTWIESGMEKSPQELAQVAEVMIQNGIDFLQRETPA